MSLNNRCLRDFLVYYSESIQIILTAYLKSESDIRSTKWNNKTFDASTSLVVPCYFRTFRLRKQSGLLQAHAAINHFITYRQQEVLGNTKPVVVVPVVWIVPVTVCCTTVPCIVVPGAAAENALLNCSHFSKNQFSKNFFS